MHFISKPEAYSYLLFCLNQIKAADPSLAPLIDPLQEKIKIAFENHEQTFKAISDELLILAYQAKQHRAFLLEVHSALLQSNFKQSPEEKFKNPLARRYESEFFTLLMLKPTTQTLTAVKIVSDQILKILTLDTKILDEKLVLTEMNPRQNNLYAFGAEIANPTLDQLKKLLIAHDAKTFPAIMHLHYNFSDKISRFMPLKHTPIRPPTEPMKSLLPEIWSNKPLSSFYKEAITQPGKQGNQYRKFISDTKMYHSQIYKAPGNRGRILSGTKSTTQFGLMLPEQINYAHGLPISPFAWMPDCVWQKPNYKSAYVTDLIENDTVYVAGPSGMASVLIAQMENLANFESLELKRHYLLAIASYIVAGGFHSLHEVLAPAQYCLGLIPNYQVCVPKQDKLAPPPNYYEYFRQQMLIDPELSARRETAWHNYLIFFEKIYLPQQRHLHTVNGYLQAAQKKLLDTITDILKNSAFWHKQIRYAQGVTSAFFQKQPKKIPAAIANMLQIINNTNPNPDFDYPIIFQKLSLEAETALSDISFCGCLNKFNAATLAFHELLLQLKSFEPQNVDAHLDSLKQWQINVNFTVTEKRPALAPI